jgi:hypothetical protein
MTKLNFLRGAFLIAIIALSFSLIYAGSYAGDFVEIGVGVRASGLGGAFTALADDGSAIYWNAAGISQLKRIEVSAMRAFLYNGLANYDHLTYCQPLPNDVTIGLSWTRLTVPDVPIFDEKYLIDSTIDQRITFPEFHLSGKPDGTFSSIDDLIQFAFSKQLHYNLNLGWVFFDLPVDFHFGGNIKYVKREILEYTGTGTGFDLSFLTMQPLGRWFEQKWLGTLSIGLNFQDVGGTAINWDTVSRNSDSMAMSTKLGFAYTQELKQYKSTVIAATDTDFHLYGQRQSWGLEYVYDNLISGRVGYGSDNFSSGLTVKVYDIGVDYAFVTNMLGNSHRVGIRVNF